MAGELLEMADLITADFIRPNMQRDYDRENFLRRVAAEQVGMVTVLQGEKIVGEGEYITEEIYMLLSQFGFTDGGLRAFFAYAGLALVSAILCGIMSVYIWFYHRKMTRKRKEMVLLFVIYTLTVVMCWSLNSLPYYFMPLLLFAVLTALLLEVKLSIVLTMITTVVCSLIYGESYEFLVYFAVMGLIVCILAKYTAERNNVIKISLLFAGISAVVVTSLHLVGRSALVELPLEILFSVLLPVIIVIFAVGSLPFWEVAFGITTPLKLLELIGPDKPLIRKLANEAPGTYHHSLIVANLAETAALEVGANHVLARVGAYYHDIGKLGYPGYFSENIVGKNPHDELEPKESADIIFDHVNNGLKLALQYKVPPVIREFIEQHHGNTLMAYFYHKEKKSNPDAEVDEAAYRYPHPTPVSKEIAIVMLADTCEAAVRSTAPTGKDYEETKKFVWTLLRKKLEENQLSESGLSIRDLDVIAEAFMGVFKGMYHDRVKYEKKEEARDKIKEGKPDEAVVGKQDGE
jgi:hypothetical protein